MKAYFFFYDFQLSGGTIPRRVGHDIIGGQYLHMTDGHGMRNGIPKTRELNIAAVDAFNGIDAGHNLGKTGIRIIGVIPRL